MRDRFDQRQPVFPRADAALEQRRKAFGGGSRLEQRFAVTTALAGAWALETGLRVRHEFETQPGSEPTDTRLDVSIVREF